MVENSNASKTPSNAAAYDTDKYVGVASLNVVAINPNNEKLRSYGYEIPEDAEEPEYVKEVEDKRTGRPSVRTRIRLLAQIQDLKEKPIVSLDFFVRPEVATSGDGQKGKIIDTYGRTAWGTRDEISKKQIPIYSSGNPANISTPYKMCHWGEEEIVRFLMRYLNVTPLQMFDNKSGKWQLSKNPGRLTIDNWEALSHGNTEELAKMLSERPDNCLKVVLGVVTTEDNKTYQTFINLNYIGNGQRADYNTGIYTSAQKLIDKFNDERSKSPNPGNSIYHFSAAPVKKWTEEATEVTDNSDSSYEDDMPDFESQDGLPF